MPKAQMPNAPMPNGATPKASMTNAAIRFVAGRAAAAIALVLVASSGALLLAQMAPGDYLSSIGGDPAVARAERHRLGLDRPVAAQYGAWLSRSLRLDLGESFEYRRPVIALVGGHAKNTAILAASALVLATVIGIPAGVLTGSRRKGIARRAIRGASLLLLSVPPLITSLALVTLAAATGWLPVSGMGGIRHLVIPSLALGLPIAALLERLQSQAIGDALGQPSMTAALARGIPRRWIVWRHALRLSLGPTLAVYGVVVGSVFSGSFAVEVVTSWPGLGSLMRGAIMTRDTNLVAGCAAAGAVFLAAGIFASDVAHAWADPRLREDA
jgi:ABC-type dipeptide/oligopeptide/nickel transport system permease component